MGGIFCAGCWGTLHNELPNLYVSPNIIRVVRVGHVAGMGEVTNAYKILVEDLKGGNHLENLGVEGRIILE
jgi:hypothetical protein